MAVDGPHIELVLAAGAQCEIHLGPSIHVYSYLAPQWLVSLGFALKMYPGADLGMALHANTDPSYLRPWDEAGAKVEPRAQSIRSIEAGAKM